MSQPNDYRRPRRLLPVSWSRRLASWELTPARIALLYLAFGVVALFVSDVVFIWLFDGQLLRTVQAGKGLIEVLVTAGLIYVLTSAGQTSLRKQAAELDRNRTELRVLHRLLRHNLRNNLTILRGESRRLRQNLTEPEDEAVCDAILESIDDVIELTEQAQDIRRLTARDETTTVDLATRVPELVDAVDAGRTGATVSVRVPDEAWVSASTHLGRALAELVANAVEHHDGDARVAVVVDPERGPAGTTTVEVTDDGPGLPDYVERVLVDGEQDDLVHLDGLGLWFVYLAVVRSGGEFEIPRSGPDGTTVRMRLPEADPVYGPTGALLQPGSSG